MLELESLTFIKGGSHVDHRGELKFNNKLNLSGFRRMYQIENSSDFPSRGWHGHVLEAKVFTCVSGEAEVAGVRVDNWSAPSKDLIVEKFTLQGGNMDAVFVPSGYANALKFIMPGTIVQVLSSSTLEESLVDDVRYPLDYWLI